MRVFEWLTENEKLWAILILLAVTACQKNSLKKKIIGSWELVSILSNTEVNLNEDNVANSDIMKEMPDCYEYTCTFYKDGDYASFLKDAECKFRVESGKWKLMDETLKINYNEDLYHQHRVSVNEKMIWYDGFTFENIKADLIFERK